MKTAEEILKMTKEELRDYKWSQHIETKDNDNCFRCSLCSDCSRCSDCFDCSDCYLCRNAKGLRYAICNVVLGKENYERKMRELAESK
jgi:hypothetical protein